MEKINFECFKKSRLNFYGLIALEIISVFLLISFSSNQVSGILSNNGNATVITYLNIGHVYPEILNISLDSPVTLNVNSTKVVSCQALLRDYNNDTSLNSVTAVLYNSTFGNSDDNNDHYTNNSCIINLTGSYKGVADTNFTALANCTFQVYYYANPGNWNCTMFVNDTTNWNTSNSVNGTINPLLGLELPDSINYGTVNATSISEEVVANVSNAGNVKLNLSLSGYGSTVGDGNAMNCSFGALKNISIMYEKYNLTLPNIANNKFQFENGNYTNLTTAVAIKKYDLASRSNDTYNNAVNSTYWRIYVPIGVAGTCSGNIVFGASAAPGN